MKRKFQTQGVDKQSLISQFNSVAEELKSAQRQLQECRSLITSRNSNTHDSPTIHTNDVPPRSIGDGKYGNTLDHGESKYLNTLTHVQKNDEKHNDNNIQYDHHSDANNNDNNNNDNNNQDEHKADAGGDDAAKKPADSPHEDGEDGQGGPPMLGVGGDEERQGEPQNPDLVLGINQPVHQPDKGNNDEGPQLRGNDKVPDYQSDNDGGN